MSDGFEAVADAVDRARELLLAHGEQFISQDLSSLVDRLRAHDKTAIVTTISEVTGGMGSLSDRYLSPGNGDKIAPNDVCAVNERLTNLVRSVEAAARSVAASEGIELIR